MSTVHTSSRHPSPGPVVPPATRAQSPGWRDPRIILGVVIVVVCVVLGSRVLADADDTVAVWSVRRDLPAGSTLADSDLVPVRVHFSGNSSDRYLSASSPVVSNSRLTHDLAAGELVPRSAVTTDADGPLVEVPLSAALDDVPDSVREGAVVDVWVTPRTPEAGQSRPRARLALDDVVVVAVPAAGDSLAPQTTRQVIVGVDVDRAADLADALGLMADGRIVLTRQGRP
jgi:hypothetical protein